MTLPTRKILSAKIGFPPRSFAITGAAFAGGQRQMSMQPRTIGRESPKSFSEANKSPQRKSPAKSARISILNVNPCCCGGTFDTKVSAIIRPMQKGISGESTCAQGSKMPKRIASGIKMERSFAITQQKLVNWGDKCYCRGIKTFR